MTRKSPALLQREIDEALSRTTGPAQRLEPESKKERAARLMKALRAARSLEFEARNTRDYLNPAWDSLEVMRLSDEAVKAAEVLLSAIAKLKND